jgi:2-dehydro-3-deoxyphosphogalactonate aldolase
MRLKDIRTFVVGNPPPHFGGRWFVFVKLTTDDNISGIGESYGVPFHPDLVAGLLEDVFGRYLADQDPHDIELLTRRVYGGGFTQHPDLAVMGVFSALEMACWDIIGKAAGQAASCHSRRWIAPSCSCAYCARRSARGPICCSALMDR